MQQPVHFIKVEDRNLLTELQTDWQKSLLGPQDGMWEIFRSQSTHWSVKSADKLIGFAVANEENGLLNFYLQAAYLNRGIELLHNFLSQEKIDKALIGTHNPVALSLVLHLQKKVIIDTYLFSNPVANDASPEAIESSLNSLLNQRPIGSTKAKLQLAELTDLVRLVDFYHDNIGAPKDWLSSYLGGHVEREECFFLQQEEEIIGVCEVRKSESQAGVADLGMVVAADHRRQGLGTYLLSMAGEIARHWDCTPICSCEADNIGSRKSIEAAGMRTRFQLLRLEL